MNPVLKRAFDWAGSILSIIAIFFVALRLYEYSDKIEIGRLNYVKWCILLCIIFVYGIVSLILVFSWKNILQFLGVHVNRVWALHAYGTSQLARYIPGNIFHYASRQAIGIAKGYPGWLLAKSAVLELVIISFVGLYYILLSIPLLYPTISIHLTFLLFISLKVFSFIIIWKWISPLLARAFGGYAIFLFLSGLIFFIVVTLISAENSQLLILPSCCAYVVAWLAGLLVPGAPAGIGVRELVLLFFFRGSIAQADLLLAVLIGRFVTVGGDLLFFIVAINLNRTFPNLGE